MVMLYGCVVGNATAIVTAPQPLSPARLRAIASEAWPLLPVPPDERKHLLRDEAAFLVDRLLVQVARSSGAIAVAMGECLAALCSGDGPMRLGYSGIGDYAREALSLAPRTALELAKLARELRERPLLREAVRAGEVSVKKAEAVLQVAKGDAEVFWVARAKRETVNALIAAVRGGPAPEEQDFDTIRVELEVEERTVVDEAMGLAGQLVGAALPRWQRLEAMCQEFLGAHPEADDGGDCPCSGSGGSPSTLRPPAAAATLRAGRHGEDVRAGPSKPAASFDLQAWLEREYERWSYLYQAEPVPAPEAGVSNLDRARRIDARLGELAAVQRGWDELLGHLCLLLLNTGLWRDMQFADLGHYARERLGMSARTVEKRAWLERRMWELPAIRQAMREGRIGYEKALLVARCESSEYVAAWIAIAEAKTCIELKRLVEADADAQMCARRELRLRLPEDVRALFSACCRVARAGPSRTLLLVAEHFIATWKVKERRTKARRVIERDQGWCTVPVCSRPAVHAHHIQYRSHGGDDDEANQTGLCLAHHLHGVHKDYVRVWGTAPHDLHWDLGER
jgi:hypothetical protein